MAMFRHPLILISPSVEKRGVEFQDLSSSLSLRYERSITGAGGLPVMMPATTDKNLIAECVARVDGILMTGGDDICPDLYAKRLSRKIRDTVEMSPDGGARDLRELVLLRETFQQRKPLLAICRGHQLLNIALGGTLFADIPSQVPEAINHARSDRRNEVVHQAQLTRGSLLARITNERTMGVNSAHHQAVDRVAEALCVTARSPDGVVEAMELKPETSKCLPFLVSVQFHPERMAERHPEHAAIFRAFVRACAPNRKRKL